MGEPVGQIIRSNITPLHGSGSFSDGIKAKSWTSTANHAQGRVRRICPLASPEDVTGACRAAPTPESIQMDTADKDRQIRMPLLILWEREANRRPEFPTVWRKFASNLVDASTGHYLQGKRPTASTIIS